MEGMRRNERKHALKSKTEPSSLTGPVNLNFCPKISLCHQPLPRTPYSFMEKAVLKIQNSWWSGPSAFLHHLLPTCCPVFPAATRLSPHRIQTCFALPDLCFLLSVLSLCCFAVMSLLLPKPQHLDHALQYVTLLFPWNYLSDDGGVGQHSS